MQNRASLPAARRYEPIHLPDAFPVHVGRHSPGTAPLTVLHQHDCLELGLCHAGAGVFVVEQKVLPFGAGDVSVINDREVHLARSAAETGSEWTFVSLDPARLWPGGLPDRAVLRTGALGGPSFSNILSAREHPEVVELVRHLVAALETHGAAGAAVVRGLALAILGRLHRIAAAAGCDLLGQATGDREATARVAPALEHLARAYAEPVRVPDLAARCHLSEAQFRRVFAQATGQAPQAYLARLRVSMAATLLESTDAPVTRIALAVGYPSLSSFHRQFGKLMGMPPRAWRRRADGSFRSPAPAGRGPG